MAAIERSARVWLFHLKHLQGQRGQLSLNITREVCEYLVDSPLIYVVDSLLRYFDFHTFTWGRMVRFSTPIVWNIATRWVVHEGRVFCCGGGEEGYYYGKTAYILAEDGAVERKADMKEDRGYHGLIALHTTVLVFGGRFNRSCEKFQVLTNKWTYLLPVKERRWNFNPCMLKGVIYLCGEGATTMEAYAPDTNTFLPLSITLPESTVCYLYVDNSLLIVNSQNYILKYAVGLGGKLVEQSRVKTPAVIKESNPLPIVDRAKGLYFMVLEGKCLRIHMQTGVSDPNAS